MSGTSRRVMVLGVRPNQEAIYRAAKTLDLEVIGVDPEPDPTTARLVDRIEIADLADLRTLLGIAEQWRPDGVCTFAADYPVRATAQLCEALDLPGLSVASAERSTDKAQMRSILQSSGIPVPHAIESRSAADAARSRSEFRGDIIVKPVDSSGGRGVAKLTRDESSKRFDWAFARAAAESRTGRVLVEDYVDGPEYSVEAVTVDGQFSALAVTKKTTSGPPYFVEMAHEQPSLLPDNLRKAVESVARECANALGIDASPSHAEVRLGPAGPTLIEIGARCGGGQIASHLVPISTGIDLARCCLQIALGESPDLTPTRSRAGVVRFLEPVPGSVVSVDGIAHALEVAGIHDVQVLVEVGGRVRPYQDARDRIGYVIAEGATVGEAADACAKAMDQIVIETTE